ILWGHGIELLLDDDRRFDDFSQPVTGYVPSTRLGTRPADGIFVDDSEPARRYLTAPNLSKALAATKLAKGNLKPNHPKTLADGLKSKDERKRTLDIIGLDACSMSMIEVASAVQDYTDFMIASQEDVPDVSFPYEKILKALNEEDDPGNVTKICEL